MLWTPTESVSAHGEFILRCLKRHGKFYTFLRLYRHRIFTEAFQQELVELYRDSGAGKSAVLPALMAMVLLLQAYTQVSDAEAVNLPILDQRWQMVLDCHGATEPLYSQGTIVDFRNRMVKADFDVRLLERTREVAFETKAFDAKKLPKNLRVAMDSSPLEGAGRVEDTTPSSQMQALF